jgi:hyperosmotically inducible protein
MSSIQTKACSAVFISDSSVQGGSIVALKISNLLVVIAVAVVLAGCNNSANENANANGNANRATVNANAPVANNNSNANDNRGLTREDYERNKEKYAKEAKDAGRKIGAGVSDGWLWVKTRYELAATDDLRDSTINVDLENGVATLTGTVPTAAQRVKAEQVAKAVEGVTAVKNMIKVAPANANANANTKAKASPPRK